MPDPIKADPLSARFLTKLLPRCIAAGSELAVRSTGKLSSPSLTKWLAARWIKR